MFILPRGNFCTVLIYVNYNILNKLSEYIYFYVLKNNISHLRLLVFENSKTKFFNIIMRHLLSERTKDISE